MQVDFIFKIIKLHFFNNSWWNILLVISFHLAIYFKLFWPTIQLHCMFMKTIPLQVRTKDFFIEWCEPFAYLTIKSSFKDSPLSCHSHFTFSLLQSTMAKINKFQMNSRLLYKTLQKISRVWQNTHSSTVTKYVNRSWKISLIQ